MPELTLESLAARVEVLERAAMPPNAIPLKNGYYVIPGTGDWAAAEEAAKRLAETYDFDAYRDQHEVDMRDARAQAAKNISPRSA
jgi:hypothetical protein